MPNELDLGFQPTLNISGESDAQQVAQNKNDNDDVAHIGDDSGVKTTADITGQDGTKSDDTTNRNDDAVPSSTGSLEPNSQIEYDGQIYNVDETGNIVDQDGNVFKEAKDVEAWLKENEIVEGDDENKELSISSIQEAIGVDVTDANGNLVEFTNDANGISSYVQSVMNIKSREIQEATINRFFESNPLVAEFMDYVQVNNGSPAGFGTLPDRSKIQLNKDNEQQQEIIIRMAAREFGNNSLNDNYIKYLKDSGGLYDEAKIQLENLIAKDNQVRENIARQAEQQRQQEQEDTINYWKNVNSIIESRNIAGYKIPESITKEVDGRKIILTPDDFFDYLTRRTVTDDNGNKITPYQRDLNAISEEEELNKDLLDAWLLFTGGTYKDLVDMAIKEEKVRMLRVKSKEPRIVKPVRIIKGKHKDGKVDINDIVL